MSDTANVLERLFLDAIAPDTYVNPDDAREAGIPAKFIESVRHRSLRITDADAAREAAASLAESIDEHRKETSTTDPVELSKLVPRI